MTYNAQNHHRRTIRLKDHEYAGAGAYYVTVCAWQRECLFGEIVDGEMLVNDFGQLMEKNLQEVEQRFPSVVLDAFVVMPNHIHFILFFVGADFGRSESVPESGATNQAGAASRAPTLGDVVCAFKSISAIQINKRRDLPGGPVWQRNYYERVIRDEKELAALREYIENNPQQWSQDHNHPPSP